MMRAPRALNKKVFALLSSACILLMTACDPTATRESSTQIQETENGHFVSPDGVPLRQRTTPVTVSFDVKLSDALVSGCKTAIHTINSAVGRIVLEVNSVYKQKNHVHLAHGLIAKMPAANDPDARVLRSNFDNSDHDDTLPDQAEASLEVRGNYIQSASIIFDTRFEFSNDPKDQEYDAESVCVHELSHALGLSHSNDPQSVMYFGLQNTQLRRKLTTEDVAKLKSLYDSKN